MEWVKQNASEGWNYEDVKMSDKSKTFEVFFPKECDLDKINRVIIRRREFIEVVRCEDCKYYKEGFCYNPNTYDDEKTCGNTAADWFCADGKRKE